MTPQEALKTYFGYDTFRPLQEEIIQSVLDGEDTLALMPTGGGKSLCFQIPAIVKDGLCLVVSPLIALMKDQVENLRQRGIMATAIYTGMSHDQQQVALDNCEYGPYRCLYVSPERLENLIFRKRLCRLPICLIAVDEAHCVSQWGYDFRPSYLHIAQLRDQQEEVYLKDVPILALTATATPEVVEDIQQQLGFRNRLVLRKSFARPNISYVVRRCANERTNNTSESLRNKKDELQYILSRVQGSAIVYVRNRKRCEELATLLQCTFYHAGLSSAERNSRQEAWKKGAQRIIVCTNAFGMGVDKPDVRLVIHYDMPDSLEAYFQEAGRAGRDEKKAFAILLYAPEDRAKVQKRIADNYPPREFVEMVYHKTCDFFCVGAGSGLGHSFALHMDQLCQTMHLPILTTYSALHLLDQAGYIGFEEERETQARVMINVPRRELQDYHLSSSQNALIQSLMRTYPGIFTELQYFHEELTEDIHQDLASMAARHILTYVPRTRACQFTFTRERQREIYLPLKVYEERQAHYTTRLRAMLEYAEQQQFCRSQILLHYFGETDAPYCGTCDICRSRKN